MPWRRSHISNEYEIKYSSLCPKVTSEGKSVQDYIYEDGNWTVWDDPFKTDDEALDEVFDTIEKEGISSLIGTENNYLH